MKRIAIVALCTFIGHANAQTWNMNMLTDSISITGPYTDTRDIVVSERQMRYTEPIKKFGLHFRNRLNNAMSNNVSISNLFGSPIIGAHGAGTVVDYSGNFQSAGGQSFPSLCVLDSGKITLTANARVNLILAGSFFTRQFWCLGDGTGTVEFAPGFVADRTNQGAVADGLGSIRFSNCNFVTHETQGLPLGYRPNPAMINSHLVFEDQPGSRWITKTNAQDYKGGLWVRASMTVETQSDLILSGKRSVWSDYTNVGGITMESPFLQLVKEGSGTLEISGEQAYNEGSLISIRKGTVRFKTDPFVRADSLFFAINNRVSGQNLQIELTDSAKVIFESPTAHISGLILSSNEAQVQVHLGSQVVGKLALIPFGGRFLFSIPSGTRLTAGDTFQVFRFQSIAGWFSNIVLPDYGGRISWDTSRFLTHGILKVAQGEVVTEIEPKPKQILVMTFPNPAHEFVNVVLPQQTSATYSLRNLEGKEAFQQTELIGSTKIQLPKLNPGLYLQHIRLNSGALVSKLLVLE